MSTMPVTPVLPVSFQEMTNTVVAVENKMMSLRIQEDPFLGMQPNHGNIEKNFILSRPNTGGDPNLRWLILDGRRLALSHGCDQTYSYRGIALAVQYFWDWGHRKLIVCVPVRKRHKVLPECEIHYLDSLEHELQDLLLFMPSEAMEASFMEALAREMDALIVTQLGPDTWSEPNQSILQFSLTKVFFMIPEYPRGRNGPSLEDLLAINIRREFSFHKEVNKLMQKWEGFSKIFNEPPYFSSSKEPGYTRYTIIIDGSNVAMSHGLYTFYSCLGIYLAVLHFWKNGCRNNTACVPNWRYNSRNTVYGHKYLEILYKKGFLTLTPSICYDDRLMLEIALKNNGMIVINDKFKDLEEEWGDVINKRIPFKFDGNHFIEESGPGL